MAFDDGAVTRQDQRRYRIAIGQVDVEASRRSVIPTQLPDCRIVWARHVDGGPRFPFEQRRDDLGFQL